MTNHEPETPGTVYLARVRVAASGGRAGLRWFMFDRARTALARPGVTRAALLSDWTADRGRPARLVRLAGVHSEAELAAAVADLSCGPAAAGLPSQARPPSRPEPGCPATPPAGPGPGGPDPDPDLDRILDPGD